VTDAGRLRGAGLVVLTLLAGVPPAPGTLAQPPANEDEVTADEAAPTGAPSLRAYYDAMAEARLVRRRGGSLREARTLVARGEALADAGRHDAAVLVLSEVVDGPRFADFVDDDEVRNAELSLAGSLEALGALRSARRVLARILERGPDDRWFDPAVRRAVDVALAAGDLPGSLAWLEAALPPEATLPEDARNELRYVRGRVAFDAGDPDAARAALGAVTRRSRFHAPATYLLGVLEVRNGDLDAAEERFCRVAQVDDTDRFTFFVDDRHFEVQDLAWLALGRIAHEGRRTDDAFYYYFQVPNDSERVAEALFEAAWSMFEGDQHDTALDLLDQLQTRFPASPYVDEANLLRGYVYLHRCEFEKARRLFVAVEDTFRPVLAEVERILESPSRQAVLAEALLAAAAREEAVREERRRALLSAATSPERVVPGRTRDDDDDDGGDDDHRRPAVSLVPGRADPLRLVLALLRVDPQFLRLHRDLRTLDAEAARSGRLAVELGAIRARLVGDDAPRAASAPDDDDGVESAGQEVDRMRVAIADARATLRALTGQLDAIRRTGDVGTERLAGLEDELARAGRRLDALEGRLRVAAANASGPGVAPADAPGEPGDGPRSRLLGLLDRDAAAARALPARVAEVRGQLVEATNRAALRSLRALRSRLAENLRKARIGRIDAVMGSKRRIEIQVESLAAGRFPPELFDPLSMQGLLRDDEEYWPYDGEHWADEFDETVPLDEAGGER